MLGQTNGKAKPVPKMLVSFRSQYAHARGFRHFHGANSKEANLLLDDLRLHFAREPLPDAQAAKYFVRNGQLTDGALNRLEAVIRSFDPCLSCSTHAIGSMPLDVELRSVDGELADRRRWPDR